MFALDNPNTIYWTGSLYMKNKKCPVSQRADLGSLQIIIANSPSLEKHFAITYQNGKCFQINIYTITVNESLGTVTCISMGCFVFF